MLAKWGMCHLLFLPVVLALNLMPMRRFVFTKTVATPTTETLKHIQENEMNGNTIEDDHLQANTIVHHRDRKRQVAVSEAEDYSLHTAALPWMDAMATCWRDGGRRLATPRTLHEAQTLGALLSNAASHIDGTAMRDALYIGANHLASHQGRWMSQDGRQRSDLGFATWLGGPGGQSRGREPQRDCAAVLSDGSLLRVRCGERLAFACETSLYDDHHHPQQQQAPSSAAAASQGYFGAGRLGLLKVHATPLPWVRARAACEREGAHLAVAETRRVAALLAEAAAAALTEGGFANIPALFVGVNDLAEEGDWRTLFGRSVANSAFNMWAPGEPSGGRAANCGLLRLDGRLAAAPCSEDTAFLCKKGASPVVASAHRAPHKQEQLGQRHYSLHVEGLDWLAAVGACRRDNATLAIPTSEDEALFLVQMLNGTGQHMRNVLDRSLLHIGVHDVDGDGVWTSIFGQPLEEVGYGNWSTSWRHYPENNGNRCAMLDCNGQYINYPCGNRYAYVCEKSVDT